MQYRSRPNDRSSLGEHRALFDRNPIKPRGPAQISHGLRLAKSPTVLVADDNDETREMLQLLLAAKGYRVIEAGDGERAVEVIQLEDPGLVLLDLELPRLNGLNVIHRLRKDLRLNEIPVVVITGHENHFDTAVAAGCDDYLLKPIDFDRLDAILDYYVPTTTHATSA